MKKHTQFFVALMAACAALLAPQAYAATTSFTYSVTLTSGCTFSAVTAGTLAFNSTRTTMGTEVSGGTRSSFGLAVIGSNVVLTLSAPTVTVASTADTGIAAQKAQLFTVSTGGTASYSSTDATGLTVVPGFATYYVGFTIPRASGAWGATGAHLASTTLTCT